MNKLYASKNPFLIGLIAILAVSGILLSSCEEDNPVASDDGVEEVSAILADNYGNLLPETIVELHEGEVDINADLGVPIAIDTTDSDGTFSFEIKGKFIDKLYLRIQHPFIDGNAYLSLSDYKAKIKDSEEIEIKIQEKEECAQEVTISITLGGENTLEGNEKLIISQEDKKLLYLKPGNEGSYVADLCPGTYTFTIKIGDKTYSTIEEVEETTELLELELQMNNSEECCTGGIEVSIKDETGASINGVEVWLRNTKEGKEFNKKIMTEEGLAKFVEICEGKYEARISKEGYAVQEMLVEIDCGLTAEKNIVLKVKEEGDDCCDNILKVLVATDEGTKPIKGAKVLLRKNGKPIEDPRTDEEGMVTIDGICKGEGYSLLIEAEGHKVYESESFSFDCEEAKEMVIKLEKKEDEECCKGNLIVDVADKEGNALEEVEVWLRNLPGKKEFNKKVKTNDGRAAFEGICEGEYEIRVAREGYDVQEIEIGIECEKTTEISVKLEKKETEDCCDNILKVLVATDEGTKPIKGAKVLLRKNGKPIEDPRTDEEGMVTIDGICKGEGYSLLIEAEGHKVYESESFSFDCEEAKEMVIKLEKKEQEECCDNILSLKVKNEDGEAIKGAKILFKKDGKVIEDPRTNEDGMATIDGICKGDGYYIVVQAEGYQTREIEIEAFDCGEKQVYDITLEAKETECCEAWIKVIVMDNNENPIQDAVLIVRKNGKAIEDPRTNGDGEAVVDGLCEGEGYSILIKKDGYEPYESDNFTLKCTDEKVFTVKLSK